jgi:hypothetical protein
MLNVALNLQGYGKMKKFLDSLIFCLFIFSFGGSVSAGDYLVINADVTGDGQADVIKLTKGGTDFFVLVVTSGGKEIFKNDSLVPTKKMNNSGGLDVSHGLSVVDGNLVIQYYFCEPSTSVCYSRNVVGTYKDGSFLFSREEVVASAEKTITRDVFYQRPATPLSDLTYQKFLENDGDAKKLFSSAFGTCVQELGGDSLMKISDELEKESPAEWVRNTGCVTPALVFSLQGQGLLTMEAALRYVSSLAIK